MNIFLKTLLIYTIALTTSLCHSYPIYLKILYHPQTKALIGLMGDRHFFNNNTLHDRLSHEEKFHTSMNDLHTVVQSNAYTLFFESNKESVDNHIHKKTPLLGLISLAALAQKNPLYQALDPRTEEIRAFLALFLKIKPIAHYAHQNFILYLKNLSAHIHHASLKQAIQSEIASLEGIKDSCDVLNNYLYNDNKKNYIPEKVVYAILLEAISTLTSLSRETLETYTLHNLLLKIYAQVHNILQTIPQQKGTAYEPIMNILHKKCADIFQITKPIHDVWSQHNVLHKPLLQGLIELGKCHNNNFDPLFSQEKAIKPLQTFFKYVCLTTLFDITSISHMLAHKKSLLFAGDAHCTAINTMLCDSEQGFVEIFSSKTKPTPEAYFPEEVQLFYQTLDSYAKNPAQPAALAQQIVQQRAQQKNLPQQ